MAQCNHCRVALCWLEPEQDEREQRLTLPDKILMTALVIVGFVVAMVVWSVVLYIYICQ